MAVTVVALFWSSIGWPALLSRVMRSGREGRAHRKGIAPAFQRGDAGSDLTEWLLHNDSLTIAIEYLNLDWHRLLHDSICYFFRS